ncbi:hypothetical protein ACU686_10020 [Yinghuangia aomiensis]
MMNEPPYDDGVPAPVRIPKIKEQDDRILGPFTARQAAWLTAVFLLLWAGWLLARGRIPGLVYLAFTVPGRCAGCGRRAGVARRDAPGPDPRRRVPARPRPQTPRPRPGPPQRLTPTGSTPPGPTPQAPNPPSLQLPAEDMDDTGVPRLGKDGMSALAVCGTVNFALRTGPEQASLTAAFARCSSTPRPARCRSSRLRSLLDSDRTHIARLRRRALRKAGLRTPHRRTRRSRIADFLDRLADGRDLPGEKRIHGQPTA